MEISPVVGNRILYQFTWQGLPARQVARRLSSKAIRVSTEAVEGVIRDKLRQVDRTTPPANVVVPIRKREAA